MQFLFVWSIVFYFYNVFPNAFYNKQLQTLFKDHLVRSEATCSFNVCLIMYSVLYSQHLTLSVPWSSRSIHYTSLCVPKATLSYLCSKSYNLLCMTAFCSLPIIIKTIKLSIEPTTQWLIMNRKQAISVH